MDMISFERLIDECVDRDVKHIGLTLYGEPLLDPYLIDRMARIRSVLGNGVHLAFFSNGSMLSSKMATDLLAHRLNYVNFSVDGATAESYESVRRGLKYDEVVANIMNFVRLNNEGEYHCNVRVHMTATEHTRGEVNQFRRAWLAVEGVDDVSWLGCDGRGGEGREAALEDHSTNAPCRQPFEFLLVMSNGELMMCCQDYSGSVPLGNVFEEGIERVWTSAKFEHVRELHRTGRKREIPLCARCKTRY